MRVWKTSHGVSIIFGFALLITSTACQQGAPVANTNMNTNSANVNSSPMANANSNTSVTNTATTTTTTGGAAIETREPETYRATMVITGAASGNQQQSVALPSVEIARNGADRRYAVNVPAFGPVIFLDRADKRYIIMQSRKQYAELTPEMTGLNVHSMSPEQLVAQLKKQQGVQVVGEEQLNGRTVTKYRYAATAQTGSRAGDVSTESFIYVDKETGLPLRIEGFGQSTGNVQGVNSGKVIVEMRDLRTDVEPALFEVPEGYSKLTPEQVQQQMAAVVAVFQMIMNGINTQMGGAPPATGPVSASPTVSPTRP